MTVVDASAGSVKARVSRSRTISEMLLVRRPSGRPPDIGRIGKNASGVGAQAGCRAVGRMIVLMTAALVGSATTAPNNSLTTGLAGIAALEAEFSGDAGAVYRTRAARIEFQLPIGPERLSSWSGPGPIVGDVWRIERSGVEITPEALAHELGRSRELDALPSSFGPGLFYAGLSILGASAAGLAAGLAGTAAVNRHPSAAVGIVAAATGGAGLITALIGLGLWKSSDKEVPLALGTSLVLDHNAVVAATLRARAGATGCGGEHPSARPK